MHKEPFVSIIMPVRNEADFIARSLGSILKQEYHPGNMEIIVVDGMSTDKTREIVSRIINEGSQFPIQVLDNPGKIVPTGINLALRRARGEIIIRVDGHTVITTNYVGECIESLWRTRADNVGGRMNAIANNFFGSAVAIATSTPFGIGGGRFHYSNKEEWVDTVYMGAWPVRVFEKIGLFDEELVRDQDDEFNYRLREAGGKILLSPQIKSEYTVRSAPTALWRQYFQYGLWKVRVLQKHPHQMSLRQFVPPTFIFALLISVLFALSPFLRPLSMIVPLTYLTTNLFASFWTAFRRGWKYLPLLPLTFAILHLSYGLGFLTGLLKFWNRWGDKIGRTPVWSSEING